MENCIFCKIAAGEIAKEFTYEDEDIMVFPDIHPKKPIHLLIMPKKHIPDLLDVTDPILFSKILKKIQQLALKYNLSDKGFRIVVNAGGAQIVPHLHFHLMGPVGLRITE